MKIKLLCIILLLFQIGFSQYRRQYQGKIVAEGTPIQGIEVLNLDSKRTTITDSHGLFSILAKEKDSIMFVSKNQLYKTIQLTNKDFQESDNIILLNKKPEELDEVLIYSLKKFNKLKTDPNIANQIKLEKEAKNPKPIGVYDGTITNGIDFILIGKMISKLFVNAKEKSKNKTSSIQFKNFVLSTNDNDQIGKMLHLKKDEILLFLDFCDADPKSKTVLENTNPLKLWDFLLEKNKEFKKFEFN